PQHHVQSPRLLHWRGPYHPFAALVKKSVEYFDLFHLATGFDDHVAARPVGVLDTAVAAGGDALFIYQNGAVVSACLVIPATVNRVKGQQVSQGGRISGGVVDMHEFDLGPVPRCTQCQAAHTAKAIDPNFDTHSQL